MEYLPLLSFVIPIKNERENLIYLCKSIAQQIVRESFEVVIIDDSDDPYKDAVRKCLDTLNSSNVNVRYAKGLGNGVGSAMFLGLSSSRGLYVFFLDADNILAPNFTEEVLPLLNAGFFVSFLSKSLDEVKGVPGLLYASNLLATLRKGLKFDSRYGFVNTLFIWRRDLLLKSAELKYPRLSLLDQINLGKLIEEHEKNQPRTHVDKVLVYDARHKFDAITPSFIYHRLLWYYSALTEKNGLKKAFLRKDPVILLSVPPITAFIIALTALYFPLVALTLISTYALIVASTMKVKSEKPLLQLLLGILWLPLIIILRGLILTVVLIKLLFRWVRE